MRIESSRLALESLSLEELINYEKDFKLDRDHIDISELIISETQRKAIRIKVEKMKDIDESIHEWYTYWLIINKFDYKALGLVGFKGIDDTGKVEIGYGITPKYEGRGYMSEAVETLIKWAFSNEKCTAITATRVLKANIGSRKVLKKNGFKLIDEDEDTFNFILTK
ncbi:GNAT family N-acetyltransferase [Vallitalea okinawensis]|uniref:GNAT family N-acetyltransferase n=1 Tax=Vallitalea okinawensis TaxID=2078660 RepID=UPI000CFA99AE|nr:GNAT family N-acetyltransferase [Vallitalea okinawensis]